MGQLIDMEENMITSIKIRNAATFNDEGQKIDNLKKNQLFLWGKWKWKNYY